MNFQRTNFNMRHGNSKHYFLFFIYMNMLLLVKLIGRRAHALIIIIVDMFKSGKGLLHA